MSFSEEKLRRSAEHVYYEISMFLFAVRELSGNPVVVRDIFKTNLFLESLCVHTRNLLDFFYTLAKDRHRGDDMLAGDFISEYRQYRKSRVPLSKIVFSKRRIDKQFAHLTYHRNRYNSRTKLWDFRKIYKLMYPTIVAFYDALPKHRKRWLHFVELKKCIDEYATF